MIDLRRLRVLRAVAHHGTVTAAAEALHLTPSAASQQIRQLGRDLGVTLLEPDGRRVRLSPAARDLLGHADAIEERWQRAAAALRATQSQPRGTLQVRSFRSAIVALAAPMAARLQAEHPELRVQVWDTESVDSFDLIFAGAGDVAIVESSPDSPPLTDGRFEQQVLLRDPFDLVVAAGHPLARRRMVTLADAAHEGWVLEAPECASRQIVAAACNAAGFSPRIEHDAGAWDVVATMVAHGLGVSLIPRLAHVPAQLAITRLPLVGQPSVARQFLTCIRRGSAKHPAIAAALAVLRDLADDHAAAVA